MRLLCEGEVVFVDDGVGGRVVGLLPVELFVGGAVVEFAPAHQPHLHAFGGGGRRLRHRTVVSVVTGLIEVRAIGFFVLGDHLASDALGPLLLLVVEILLGYGGCTW